MRQQWGLRATALAATATALVGCSVGGDDADASETGESSAVPAPQKLLALDEFAALNALTLGGQARYGLRHAAVAGGEGDIAE